MLNCLLTCLDKYTSYTQLQRVKKALISAAPMPKCNNSYLFYHDSNIRWECVIPALFRREGYLATFDEKYVLANKIIKKEKDETKLNLKNISGFSGGRVSPMGKPKSLVEIGAEVSREYEVLHGVDEKSQLSLLTAEAGKFLGKVVWSQWYRRYAHSAEDGSHRTCSLVYLLNKYHLDFYANVKLLKFSVDFSTLSSMENLYSLYLFNDTKNSDVVDTHQSAFGVEEREQISTFGGDIRGYHYIGNDCIRLIAIDKRNRRSLHLDELFRHSTNTVSLRDFLEALINCGHGR